jgi:hypothetical protein
MLATQNIIRIANQNNLLSKEENISPESPCSRLKASVCVFPSPIQKVNQFRPPLSHSLSSSHYVSAYCVLYVSLSPPPHNKYAVHCLALKSQ